jgi:two-component system, OmpR family, phosphate regulon sensor histidine kinase PhoR
MNITLFNYAEITVTAILTVGLVFLLYKQIQARAELQSKEELEKQRLYQILILKEIQDRIGYSLDVEKIIDVITGSLKYLFPYATASSIMLKHDRLIFKTYVEENVDSGFILQVKKTMFASLQALVGTFPAKIEEGITGAPLHEEKPVSVASFFNIPLIVGNQVVGLINVSSTNKNAYKEGVTVIYQIIAQATNALSKLQYVLETEKGKLTSMISSLADGVFMVDTNKNLLIINGAGKTFLNIKSITPNLTDVLTAVGTQYNLLDKIEQSIATNAPIKEKEVAINDKFFEIFITPVPSAMDERMSQPIGASILFHDITIEKTVATIKEDFTHMMVHELRAPLTAIKDSAELMIETFEEKGGLEKEQQKRLLKIMDMQSKNLLEQINQVLDAAKIEAGKFSIVKESSDIGAVIQSAVEPYLPQANKKQILISTDIYYPLPKVDLDPTRITQVLNNLVSNSLKFTPAGGKIVVSAKPGDGFVTVGVSDNGIGIPENEQKDLFSKYYQIRTTPHQLAKKGTGLGLYIIKGIVEAHSGSVGIISQGAGKGTTIYFTLPITGGGPRIMQGHVVKGVGLMASNLIN